ncbi:hypothetical protein ACM26V_10100 [Salipaludibacillus sp. HK11]|uniref:hypothetical protein n=1 Tax=Salipaludibacillus sp. HK11 TaxID=3394320 RepID=UPI0039FC49C4
MSKDQDNLQLVYMEIDSLTATIRSYSDEWMYQSKVEHHYRKWVKSILNRVEDFVNDHPSNYHQWKLIIILLLFNKLRNQLVIKGHYSFRKKEIENLLYDMLKQCPQGTLTSIHENDTFHELITKAEQDFSHLKQLKQIDLNLPDTRSNDAWLNQWLTRPHFSKYKNYYYQLSSELEKEKVQNQVIENLFQLQAHPPTRRTFFQIIAFHKSFEHAINAWLYYPQDPLTLSREEQDVIKTIAEERSDLAIPLYMQWIEVLIEKKTSSHYQKAIFLIKELNKLMKQTGRQEEFTSFLLLLKKKYRRYVAFYEELKTYI